MTERIEKTLKFLQDTFELSEYWKKKPESKRYRYRHSVRVAKIGAEIAAKENMDVEAMTIACLLHDISYGLDFNEERTIPEHGYTSAVYSKPFLESIGYSGELLNNIVYGIAFHCASQEKLNLLEGENNTFTHTIMDADTVDHWSVYRFYEDFNKENYLIKTPEDQQQAIWGTKGYYNWLVENNWFATETAKTLFLENIKFRNDVLDKFQKLINDSKDDF